MHHNDQKKIWEEEHKNPSVLLQMDSQDASSGVKEFYNWYISHNTEKTLHGLEIWCWKGRNTIFLAQNNIRMTALDFSENAIQEAKRRAKSRQLENVNFIVHDATETFPFADNSFDFVVDCFASTDIESLSGRRFARDEIQRTLKNNGILFVYTLSSDDEFHKSMWEKNPAEEKYSFTHPSTWKFEKFFDREELLDFYKDFDWIEEKRFHKMATFFGKEYACNHFWLILKKK